MRSVSLLVLYPFVLALAACTEVSLGGSTPPNHDTDPPSVVDTSVDRVAPTAVCQVQPNTASPGEPVDLIGENSLDADDSELINYRWTLAKKPTGSKASLPLGDANVIGFEPDLLGTYVATLVVTDASGKPSNACAATLNVLPAERLYVQVTTSRDDHIRPILTKGADWPNEDACKPTDCDGSWGGTAETPVATETAGAPTVVAIADPADGTYGLRLVDDLEAGDGLGVIGDVDVHIEVWLDGAMTWQHDGAVGLELTNTALATIVWPSKSVIPAP